MANQSNKIASQSAQIIVEIQRRARAFVKDNIPNPKPSDYLLVESAMLIGSTIAIKNEQNDLKEAFDGF